jgi:hypothetical protein
VVTARFTLERAEYASALRQLRLRSQTSWVMPISGGVLVALGVALSGQAFLRGIETGIGAVYVLMFASGLLIAPGAFARRAVRAGSEMTYVFSEDSFTLETARSRATFDWSQITRCFRARGLTVLMRTPGVMHVIPDRAFESPDDRERFIELATRPRTPPVPLEPLPTATGSGFSAHRPQRRHLIAVLGATAVAIAVAVGLASAGGSTAVHGSFGAFAGYQWDGRVTSVQASWIVPRILRSTPRRGLAGQWIGAQTSSASGPFIQIGTEEWDADPARDPRRSYFAFWSDTKHHYLDQPLFNIDPGDTVSATLKLTGGRWVLGIIDTTTGTNAYFSTAQETNGSFTQASWLQEHVVGTRPRRPFAYPRLTTVGFRGLRVNSTAPSYGDLCPSWMSENGQTLAPTALHADSFTLEHATSSLPAPGYFVGPSGPQPLPC